MNDTRTSRAARKRFREELPYPIAISYKRIGGSDGYDNRLRHVLFTAEMTARFLGIVALADLRRVLGTCRLRDGAFARKFPDIFSRPSFGTWLWILRESLLLVREHGGAPFVHELWDFYFTEKGKPTDAVKALSELVVTRNRHAHDRDPPDERLEPRQVLEECERGLGALHEVLERVMFLADYPLVIARPIEVEKKRHEQPTYVRRMIMLAGYSDVFDRELDRVTELCESEEVLLLHPDAGTYLNLDPLVLHSSEGRASRQTADGGKIRVCTDIPDVFIYNGGAAGKRHYLACSNGGELCTRDCAAGDYLQRGFDELLAMLGGGARVA